MFVIWFCGCGILFCYGWVSDFKLFYFFYNLSEDCYVMVSDFCNGNDVMG